jgi:hypothetical protein
LDGDAFSCGGLCSRGGGGLGGGWRSRSGLIGGGCRCAAAGGQDRTRSSGGSNPQEITSTERVLGHVFDSFIRPSLAERIVSRGMRGLRRRTGRSAAIRAS